MDFETDTTHIENLQTLSRYAGAFCLFIGLLVLTAWALKWDAPLQLVPAYPLMAPNTALALALIGIFLLDQRPHPTRLKSWLIGAPILVIGLSSLYEYIWPSAHLWTNQALFQLIANTSYFSLANRVRFPAFNTGLCFLSFGIAITFRPRWSSKVILISTFIPIISLLGQAFQLPSLYGPMPAPLQSGMAIHTAIGLFLAGLGFLARNPSESFLLRAQSRSAAGAVVRTVGLAALLVPILFGLQGVAVGLLPASYADHADMVLVLSVTAVFLGAMFFAIRVLEQSEEKFKLLVQSSYDPIFVVNGHGKIEFVNDRVSASFGYTKEELIGKPIERLVPTRYVAQHVVDRQRYSHNAKPRPMGSNQELFIRCKDNSEIPVDISLTPLKFGTRSKVAAIVRDISERKKIENQQRFMAESSKVLGEVLGFEERIQAIARQCVPYLADFCVVFIEETGAPKACAVVHKDEEMQAYLRETAETYPPTSTAMIGESAAAFPAKLVEMVKDSNFQKLAQNEDHLARLRKIGTKSYLTVPLVGRSKVIGVLLLGLVEDKRKFSTTDVAFVELVMQRFALAADNARLYGESKLAIRAREDILSIVSHDLKNPIAAIDMASQMLTKYLDPTCSRDKVLDLGQRIYRANRQMNRLVKGLLNFGQIQAGVFTVHPSPLRLAPLMDELNDLFRPLAQQSSISLGFHIHGDISFRADDGALSQALSNLIGNALKFTPPGGRIDVTGLVGDDGDLRIMVQDTGPGIPPEMKPQIFDRFWQPESSKQTGAGLGLYIVKGIVEAHHGKVWVESEPGQGACFTIQLPREASAKETEDTERRHRTLKPIQGRSDPSPHLHS